ncbi:MAG: three-Cys-motif partner protein TcmP [Gemmatimonadales bacterium]
MGRRRARRNYFTQVEDDGLLSYEIGPWAEDKYRRMGMYAEMFSTGMKNAWDTRVYLDLFSGPGYSRLRGTSRHYLGSPLIALSLPDPFDRYIFCDASFDAIEALRTRVSRQWPAVDTRFVPGDANDKIDEIVRNIPSAGRVLSFCFLDPFKLNIGFETVHMLARGRNVDFLILLALYVDANRNLDLYVREESEVIDRFLGDRDWRGRWEVAQAERKQFVAFLADEYSRRMEVLGYLPMPLEEMVKIRTHERRLPLYYLAFYSRHRRGLDFWKQVREYSSDQLEFM